MPQDRIAIIMENLGRDRETTVQVLADDKAIDQGKPMSFDLTPDQMKNTKHRGHKAPTIYTHTKRERKADNSKRELIELLAVALVGEDISAVEVSNPERIIDFQYKGRKFKITLSAPRT